MLLPMLKPSACMALLFCAAFLPSGARADAYSDLRVRATQEYQAGHHAAALDLFKQAQVLNPTPELANFIQQLQAYVDAAQPKVQATASATAPLSTGGSTEQARPSSAAQAAPSRAAAPSAVAGKSAGTVFALSLLPGGGHLYLGQYGRGAAFAVSGLGLAIYSLVSKGQSDRDYDAYMTSTDATQMDALYLSYDNAREKANYAFLGATAVWLFSILDAQSQYKMMNLKVVASVQGEPRLVASAGF